MREATARTLLAGRGSRALGVLAGADLHGVPMLATVAGVTIAGGLAVSRGAFIPLLGASVLLLYGLLLVTRPTVGLLVYVAARPAMEPWVQLDLGGGSLGELWGAGLLVSVLAYLALTRAPSRRTAPSYAVPFSFLGVYLALTLWRANADFAVTSAIKVASWIMLALAAERIARTAAGQRLILRAGYVMGVLTIGVIAVAIARNQYGAAYYIEDSFTGVGQTLHGYVGLAVLVLPILLVALLTGRRVLVTSALVAGICIGVVMSYVRTGYVALAVVMLGYVALGMKRRRPYILVAAVAGVVAIVATAALLGDTASARLNDLANLTSGAGTAQDAGAGRVGFWTAITQTTVDSTPLLLIGGGALASEDITTRVLGNTAWAHNDFLEMLATGGIGLLLCYVALLVWLYRSFWRLAGDRRQSQAGRDVGVIGLLACGAFTVVAMFNGVVTTPVTAFALLLGLARGMSTTPGRSFLDEDGAPAPPQAAVRPPRTPGPTRA
ncbi:MAG: O-Antigen ligase [Solirubrobacteraceae bacterium]|jgi:hypothetical protein|nr:O-Antigen ligase [Solirubrobacteraceae bacterium]